MTTGGATNPAPKTYTALRVSDDAWLNLVRDAKRAGYGGRAHHLGVGVYLAALFRSNPSPSNWSDNRPAELRMFDEALLNAGRFPIWYYETAGQRKPRHFNTDTYKQFELIAATIAGALGCVPRAGRAMHGFNPRVGALLEAIGLGHIKPLNEVPSNPMPAQQPGRYRRRFELMF